MNHFINLSRSIFLIIFFVCVGCQPFQDSNDHPFNDNGVLPDIADTGKDTSKDSASPSDTLDTSIDTLLGEVIGPDVIVDPMCGGVACFSGCCINDVCVESFEDDPSSCGACGRECTLLFRGEPNCYQGECIGLCDNNTMCAASETCIEVEGKGQRCWCGEGSCGLNEVCCEAPDGALGCVSGNDTSVCANSVCMADSECDGAKVCCGGFCVNTDGKTEHCGACFNDCSADIGVESASCSNGLCQYNCQLGYDNCHPEPGCETLLGTDLNCTTCADTCADNSHCSRGECCITPKEWCTDGNGNGACVDTLFDETHCGECGRGCLADQTCRFGECTCPNGGIACDNDTCNEVVNTNDSCGISCDTTVACGDGACISDVYLGAEAFVCQCNVELCGPGEQCNATGGCSCGQGEGCGALEICCDDPSNASQCIDPRNDNNNCGKCGEVCAGSCINGVCLIGLSSDP